MLISTHISKYVDGRFVVIKAITHAILLLYGFNCSVKLQIIYIKTTFLSVPVWIVFHYLIKSS